MSIQTYLRKAGTILGLSPRRQVAVGTGDQRQTGQYTCSFQLPKTVAFPYDEVLRAIALFPWCAPGASPVFTTQEQNGAMLVEIRIAMISISRVPQLEHQIQKIIDAASQAMVALPE